MHYTHAIRSFRFTGTNGNMALIVHVPSNSINITIIIIIINKFWSILPFFRGFLQPKCQKRKSIKLVEGVPAQIGQNHVFSPACQACLQYVALAQLSLP